MELCGVPRRLTIYAKGIEEKMEFFAPNDMVWQFPPNAVLQPGLGIHNDHGEHYIIYPLQDMPLEEFKGKVAEFAKCASAYLRVRSLSNV